MTGGKISAKAAAISVDDSGGTPRDLSTQLKNIEINQQIGEKEVTGFQAVANFIPGLPIHEIKADVYFDSTATTGAFTVLRGIFGSSTSKTISITPEVGGVTYSGEFMLCNLPVKGVPADPLMLGSVTFKVMAVAGVATAPAWA